MDVSLQVILAKVQVLVDSLRETVLPFLDRGRHLVRQSGQEMEASSNAEDTGFEPANGLIDRGLASICHNHLACLLIWIWAILTEKIHGGGQDFGVNVGTLKY